MKKNIPKFLLEIVIIFIGITLSFLFEEYREERKSTQLRKEIIQALITDIKFFNEDLTYGVDFATKCINRIDTCLLLSKRGSAISNKQIENMMYAIGNDHSIATNSSPAYIGLPTSGIWQQLPDSLREDIYYLYEGDYTTLKRVYDRFTEYSSNMKIRYFAPLHFSLYNQPNSTWNLESRDGEDSFEHVKKGLGDPEFRSALIVIRNQYNKSIRYQKEAIDSGSKLVVNLKNYLATQ